MGISRGANIAMNLVAAAWETNLKSAMYMILSSNEFSICRDLLLEQGYGLYPRDLGHRDQRSLTNCYDLMITSIISF